MSLYPTRDHNFHKAIDQRITHDPRRHIYGHDTQSLLVKHAYPELFNHHNRNHINNGTLTPPSTSTSTSAPASHWSAIGISQYRILRKVGSGTYGSVFHATAPCSGQASQLQHTEVAIKQLAPMQNEKALFDGFHITAIREIKILKALHHTNIIKLHDVICDRENIMQTYEAAGLDCTKNGSSGKSVAHPNPKLMQTYMIFEYMEHDLSGLLHNEAFTQLLRMAHIKFLLCQILNALQYCHETARILHRDLKSSNLLVGRGGVVKIADFGLARQFIPELRTSQQHIAAQHASVAVDEDAHVAYARQYTNRVVTLWYRAPELLLSDQNYSAAVDMWSVGCVFAEMLFTRPIFQGQNEWQQWCQIVEVCGWQPPQEARWMSKLRDKHLLIAGMTKKKGKRLERKLRAKLQPFLAQECLDAKYKYLQLDENGFQLLDSLLTLNPGSRCSAKQASRNPWFGSEPFPAPPPLEHIQSSHDYHQRQARKNPNYRQQQLQQQLQQQPQPQQQHPPHQHPASHNSTAQNPRQPARYQYSYNYVPNNTANTNSSTSTNARDRRYSNPNLTSTASNNYRRRNSLPGAGAGVNDGTSNSNRRERSRSRSRSRSAKDAVSSSISIPPPMPRFPVLHNNANANANANADTQKMVQVTLQAPNLNHNRSANMMAAASGGGGAHAKLRSAYNPDQSAGSTFYSRFKRPDELAGRSRF